MKDSKKIKRLIIITLLPAILLYSVFVIVPMFWSAYYGLFDWSGISDATFIGVDDFKEVITNLIFWKSFKNNLIIVAASVFGQIPIALGFALLLRKNGLFQRFVRSAIFFPMVVSTVVVGLIWGYIYQDRKSTRLNS